MNNSPKIFFSGINMSDKTASNGFDNNSLDIRLVIPILSYVNKINNNSMGIENHYHSFIEQRALLKKNNRLKYRILS